jgi:hypothetical protein
MKQQPGESAKDFIARVSRGHVRPEGGGRLRDLPRTVVDTSKVEIFTGLKPKPEPPKKK